MIDLDSIRKRCDYIKVYGNSTCVPELAGYVDVLVELAQDQEKRLAAIERPFETNAQGRAILPNGATISG